MEEDTPKPSERKLRPSLKRQKSLNSLVEDSPSKPAADLTVSKAPKRVSFSSINSIKPFISGADKITVWDSTYEEELGDSSSPFSVQSTKCGQKRVIPVVDKENLPVVPTETNVSIIKFAKIDLPDENSSIQGKMCDNISIQVSEGELMAIYNLPGKDCAEKTYETAYLRDQLKFFEDQNCRSMELTCLQTGGIEENLDADTESMELTCLEKEASCLEKQEMSLEKSGDINFTCQFDAKIMENNSGNSRKILQSSMEYTCNFQPMIMTSDRGLGKRKTLELDKSEITEFTCQFQPHIIENVQKLAEAVLEEASGAGSSKLAHTLVNTKPEISSFARATDQQENFSSKMEVEEASDLIKLEESISSNLENIATSAKSAEMSLVADISSSSMDCIKRALESDHTDLLDSEVLPKNFGEPKNGAKLEELKTPNSTLNFANLSSCNDDTNQLIYNTFTEPNPRVPYSEELHVTQPNLPAATLEPTKFNATYVLNRNVEPLFSDSDSEPEQENPRIRELLDSMPKMEPMEIIEYDFEAAARTIREQQEKIIKQMESIVFPPIVPPEWSLNDSTSSEEDEKPDMGNQSSVETYKSIRQKIEESQQQMDQPWWRLQEKLAEDQYRFSAFSGNIVFDVDFAPDSGYVSKLDLSDSMSDKHPAILHFCCVLFKKRMGSHFIVAAIGVRYDVLSLLDYVQLTMRKLWDFYKDFEEMRGDYRMTIDYDFVCKFKIVHYNAKVSWNFTVDLSDLENISEQHITIVQFIGKYNVELVKDFVKGCPRDWNFLRCFIQKIEEYLESSSKRKMQMIRT